MFKSKKALSRILAIALVVIIVAAALVGVYYFVLQPSAGRKTITATCTGVWSGLNAFKPFMEDWLDERGYDLNWVFMDEGSMKDVLMLAFMTNSTEYDLLQSYPSFAGAFYYSNVLFDFTGTDIIPPEIQEMKYLKDSWTVQRGSLKGHYLQAPLYGAGTDFAMLYRTDWFEQAGLDAPATFEDMMNAAKVMVEDGYAEYGVISQGGFALTLQYWMRLYDCGGMWFDNEGRNALDKYPEEALLAMENFYELYKSPYAHPDSRIATGELRTEFAAGNVAMITWADNKWGVNLNDPAESEAAGKWAVSLPPTETPGRYATMWSGSGWAVVKYSPHLEILKDLVKYLYSDEVQYGIIDSDPYPSPVTVDMVTSSAAQARWGFGNMIPIAMEQREKAVAVEGWCDEYFLEEQKEMEAILNLVLDNDVTFEQAITMMIEKSNEIRGFS